MQINKVARGATQVHPTFGAAVILKKLSVWFAYDPDARAEYSHSGIFMSYVMIIDVHITEIRIAFLITTSQDCFIET